MDFVGAKQFSEERHRMLDAFDRAKNRQANKPVQVDHGRVAEAEFRRWLKSFLPKRYEVTSGYIIPQRSTIEPALRHYDVIVFDALNSPILWEDVNPDMSNQGTSRAVPAEYVLAVFEVKSQFTRKSAEDAMNKLRELTPLLSGVDAPSEKYKKYLPPNFVMSVIFFDVFANSRRDLRMLEVLNDQGIPRGFFGGLVLRANFVDAEWTGEIRMFVSDTEIEEPGDVKLTNGHHVQCSELPDGKYTGVSITFFSSNFHQFAFRLLTILAGRYDPMRYPSFYAMPL